MTTSVSEFLNRLHHLFIQPHSSEPDGRRREFVLNTLLSGLLVAASVALLFTSYNHFVSHIGQHLSVVGQTFIFWLVLAALLVLSRRGHAMLASLVFVGFLLLSGIQFALTWGFGLATAELVFALTIVIAGILFRAPLALGAGAVVSLALITITFVQVRGIQLPSTYWRHETPQAADIVAYLVIFAIIGLVSWLSNREADRSLKRARRSEAALQKERDNLEAKVIERTHELEDMQLARLIEMQPFVEIGRIAASLVHDMANPLTAASLNLQELNKQQNSEQARQVQRSLQHLERYLLAARKQIKRQSELRVFSVGSEIRQVARLLRHRARRAGVRLTIQKVSSVKLYGDVVKFNQLIANLLANAVEACEKVSDDAKRVVIIGATTKGKDTIITVTDFGIGIAEQNIERLFEPFYSTKPSIRGGLGLGLSMVKQYVEEDFKGSITVSSSPESGTVFTIRMRGHDRR